MRIESLMTVNIKLALMAHAYHEVPRYHTDGAAGFDIPAAEDCTIPARVKRIIHTGLRFEVPQGFELQIRSRSGLSAKNDVFVLNSPGTLDSDYRGELLIILMNTGDRVFEVVRGMRIAQAVLSPVIRATINVVSEDELAASDRGSGRFGSTGI
jgi:dUTP pyrophosphatase